MKPIRFSEHALRYRGKRGFSTTEVEETIRAGSWRPAELGRLECDKDFRFDQDWNGKIYETKRIRPVFVDEPTEIVVVTVYTYYF